MQLDSYTIIAAGCAVLVILGFAFLYFWYQDRRAHWFAWWSGPFIVGGVALGFYLTPNWSSDFTAIYLGNGLRMLTVACLWMGVRMFYGRKVLVWALFAVPGIWLVACLSPGFIGNLAARIVGVSLINAVLCGLTAYEFWRGRAELLPSRRPAMWVFSSFAALMLVRVVLVNVLPFPMGALPMDWRWVGGFMFLTFVHSTFAAFLFLSLSRERNEARQRSFAMQDPLTGLMNRRAFSDHAGRAARRQQGEQQMTSLLVLDLDHFKSINDRFGHDVGDRMLTAFATASEANMRPTDMLFRMGGEEFCFVLPDTSVAGALQAAERIRRAFELVEIDVGGVMACATVSIGVASSEHAVDLELLLAAADAAVYEAKARGRNRVVLAEPAAIRRSELAALPPATRLRA